MNVKRRDRYLDNVRLPSHEEKKNKGVGFGPEKVTIPVLRRKCPRSDVKGDYPLSVSTRSTFSSLLVRSCVRPEKDKRARSAISRHAGWNSWFWTKDQKTDLSRMRVWLGHMPWPTGLMAVLVLLWRLDTTPTPHCHQTMILMMTVSERMDTSRWNPPEVPASRSTRK